MDKLAFIVEDHAAVYIGMGSTLEELEVFSGTRLPELYKIIIDHKGLMPGETMIGEFILTESAFEEFSGFMRSSQARLKIIRDNESQDIPYEARGQINSVSATPNNTKPLLLIIPKKP